MLNVSSAREMELRVPFDKGVVLLKYLVEYHSPH